MSLHLSQQMVILHCLILDPNLWAQILDGLMTVAVAWLAAKEAPS